MFCPQASPTLAFTLRLPTSSAHRREFLSTFGTVSTRYGFWRSSDGAPLPRSGLPTRRGPWASRPLAFYAVLPLHTAAYSAAGRTSIGRDHYSTPRDGSRRGLALENLPGPLANLKPQWSPTGPGGPLTTKNRAGARKHARNKARAPGAGPLARCSAPPCRPAMANFAWAGSTARPRAWAAEPGTSGLQSPAKSPRARNRGRGRRSQPVAASWGLHVAIVHTGTCGHDFAALRS